MWCNTYLAKETRQQKEQLGFRLEARQGWAKFEK